MSSWLLFAFVALDMVVMIGVALYLVKRNAGSLGVNFTKLREFSSSTNRKIIEYVRSRWSGEPSALVGVLTSLLAELEADARRAELPIERSMLKSIMGRAIESEKLASARDVQEALRQVA